MLLVDAMKTWALASQIVATFFPSLLVGDGFVIHQDFSQCFTPWIHLISYRLREYLVPVQDVPRSETVVFRLTAPFAADDDLLAIGRESFTDLDVVRAFQHSLDFVRGEKRSGVRAAQAMLYVYDGDLEAAEALLGDLLRVDAVAPYHASAVRGAIDRVRAGGAP